MIFFAILSTKRQKTFNDGGRQTTIKKVHTGGNSKKTVCGDQPIKKEPLKKPSCTQMTFFPSYPTYPTLLSFPFLSLPDPFIVPGSTPYPVLSPVLGPVSPWSPFLSSSERHFFDLIPVLAPFCTPLIARRFEVNRFLQKNNFWKRVHLRQYFYDIFEESALQLPPPPPKNDNRDKRRAKTADFLHFWNRMHCFFAFFIVLCHT